MVGNRGCGEVGTARALRWEQRMWGGRDSSECCSEGSKMGTEDVAR